MERHHVIPKQRLKKAWRSARNYPPGSIARESPLGKVTLTALLADERNLCDLCRRHHHRVTHGYDKLGLAQLPRGIADFAREFGIGWMLDRELRAFTRR